MGSRARVLLTSVFGPYAQDDEYGSRVINPMELYHNQVTRVQRAFSLRAHHRSFGLMFIQANIRTESDIRYEAVDVGRVLGKMEDAGNNLNIVVLDACRNNPFARSFRSASRGLAIMDAPSG